MPSMISSSLLWVKSLQCTDATDTAHCTQRTAFRCEYQSSLEQRSNRGDRPTILLTHFHHPHVWFLQISKRWKQSWGRLSYNHLISSVIRDKIIMPEKHTVHLYLVLIIPGITVIVANLFGRNCCCKHMNNAVKLVWCCTINTLLGLAFRRFPPW